MAAGAQEGTAAFLGSGFPAKGVGNSKSVPEHGVCYD
jgi:hypothetical protein